ncbi:MAG: hypothetical protein VX278_03535 [Myxococcota bacterium]|nr:hypothetical protein [Myxococcota bacterium]
MESESNSEKRKTIWQKMYGIAGGGRWWVPPLLLAVSILVLGWVILQAFEYASPFIYVAF